MSAAMTIKNIPDSRGATQAGWVGALVLRYEADYPEGDADKHALSVGLQKSGGWWNCPELFLLAQSLNDAKLNSIIDKMLYPASRFAKPTPRMRDALIDALLTQHRTARAVYAVALGITESALLATGKAWEN